MTDATELPCLMTAWHANERQLRGWLINHDKAFAIGIGPNIGFVAMGALVWEVVGRLMSPDPLVGVGGRVLALAV